MRLEIYNKALETTGLTNMPAVTWEQAIGNAGGLVGLWLGASMLTILELLEFLVNVVYFGIIRAWRRNDVKQNTVASEMM